MNSELVQTAAPASAREAAPALSARECERSSRAALTLRVLAPALGAAALTALFFALLVWPLLCLLLGSLREGNTGDGAFTWENYRTFFGSRRMLGALWSSVWISLLVAFLSVALCLGPAWLLVRYRFPGKRVVRALFTLPMSFSGILIGFLSVIMLGRIGAVPQFAEWLTGTPWLSGFAYQLGGVLLAYFYFEIPRATLALEAALRKLDGRLESAARSLGASSGQIFRWVVFPQILPALLSTFALTFCVSLGSFGVVLIVSKRFTLLPLEIFQQIIASNRFPLAAAMSVVLLALALLVTLGSRWLVERFQPPVPSAR
ncbi:MAG: iron ABC transporter permease [Verrucomicrobia bacterium]|nr:iron ABC transporter permease [Verrucomicrobiota bacterium]